MVRPKAEKARIRVATFEDIAAILLLDHACRLNSWTPEVYKGLILHDSCEVSIFVSEAVVAGFCVVRRARPELEILKIGVHPEKQGQGIGRALLQRALGCAAEQGCRECFLEVRWNNERAIDFYLRAGFEMIGVRKKYYKNPAEDARVMRKRLLRTT